MPSDYQSLPQAPVEGDEGVEDESLGPVPDDGTSNSSIRWIHFVFGSAVLLPWNGEQS